MKHVHTTAGDQVADVAEEAVVATSHALDSARKFAGEAAGKIGDSARELRDGAVDLARTGAESVSDATVAGQRQLGRYARATRSYVAHSPVKSALIAAGIGAAAAAIATAIVRARRG